MKRCLPAVRTLVFTILLGHSIVCGAQEGVQEAQERLRAAAVAREAGDYNVYVTHLEAALALNPASLRTGYNLARGYALLGEKEHSLERLARLVDLGVDYGIREDPDLAALRAEPAFEELLRRLADKVEPIARSRHLVTIDEWGLIPEGIAHDPASGRTFFGSMRNGEIYVLDDAGRLSRFAGLDVPGYSAIGLAIDPGRSTLWAIGTATELADTRARPETGTPTNSSPTDSTAETGTPTNSPNDSSDVDTATESSPPASRPATASTGVFGFDLGTGEPSARIFADPSIEGFNDVTVAPNGDLYASGSSLAVIPSGQRTIRPLTTMPALFGTNGLAVASDGDTLFTSVYPVGVAVIDLASGIARLLEMPEDVTLYGIDGLYLHEGDLIAIQNGTEPWRLIRIALNEQKTAVAAIRIIERANPRLVATTGAIIGNEIRYIGQGPAPEPPPSHVPAPLIPFFGKTLIMAAPLD
jgi:sugar lactone lactonase YvrE